MRTNIYSGLSRVLLALLFCCNGLFAQNDALYFDGDNDYITLQPIQGFSPNADFTVEGWFYSTATGGGASCVANFKRLFSFAAVGNPGSQFDVGECGGFLSVFWSDAFGNSDLKQMGTSIRDNQWHCISVVRSGTNVTVYLDGNVVPALASTGAGQFNLERFRVGHWGSIIAQNTPNQDWTGYVDGVKLWGTALPPASLTACNPCVLKGSESGLWAYWQFG